MLNYIKNSLKLIIKQNKVKNLDCFEMEWAGNEENKRITINYTHG